VIDSNKGPKKYPSFNGMIADLSESFADKIDSIGIFADRLLFENNIIAEKYAEIQRINENQKNLQACHDATIKVKGMSEEGSLIFNKANQELKSINESTNANIKKLKALENQSLYVH
jgi:hypothetical protein